VLFIITFVTAIPAALLLYPPVLDDANYILGAGADAGVAMGALLELLLIIAFAQQPSSYGSTHGVTDAAGQTVEACRLASKVSRSRRSLQGPQIHVEQDADQRAERQGHDRGCRCGDALTNQAPALNGVAETLAGLTVVLPNRNNALKKPERLESR
jgi:hypothetical protein